MKKKSKSKSSIGPRIDPYLEGLISKLVERLVGLEKKMDILIAQTAVRPSDAGGQSKPGVDAGQAPRRDRLLFEAICADCHKVCEVPFRPSEDRPVYCKDCFATRKAGHAVKAPSFPALTPVAMPPKTISKIYTPVQPAASSQPAPLKRVKKAAKNKPVKKSSKKR